MQALIFKALGSDVPMLDEINRRLLENAGKMLRPRLTMLFARICGGPVLTEESLRYAAAVEVLHNATLLHDDVADEAMTRRGKPTVMSYLGAVPAVLVGDFWLARAVGLLSDCSDMKWTLDAFTRTLTDLSEGEMLQQQKAFTSDTTMEDYLRIIYCKTGSLFVTACQSGAKSVQASEEMIQAAGRYGKALGLAFQFRDDILDYAGTDLLGKPVGVDLRERKITLPLLGALEGSPREAEIRAMVREIPDHPEYCEQIRLFVAERDGIRYASRRLEEWVARAEQALDAFNPGPAKEALRTIARYTISRQV